METLVPTDPLGLAARLLAALLFAAVFAFLNRESRSVYFQYWSRSWILLAAALFCRLAWLATSHAALLIPAGLARLSFAVSLGFAAAAAAPRLEARLSPPALVAGIAAAAAFAAAVLINWAGAGVLLSLVLAAAFGRTFAACRRLWTSASGAGGKIFGVSLGVSTVLAIHDALVAAAAVLAPESRVSAYLRFYDLYYLLTETLLAFSAMMMWMENQNENLRRANTDLALGRQQLAQSAEMDSLTGLLNRSALNRFCESGQPVSGVVAVLDLDHFKDINDALGHVAGDEVLASAGNLVRTSIRNTDQAWRWGGDEFVILFRDQDRDMAEQRLGSIAERLERFRLRGRGVLPIHVSWGTAEVSSGSLQQALNEADQRMYLKKKEKPAASRFFGG